MKNLKTIALLAIVMLAISCKKDKQISSKPVAAFEIALDTKCYEGNPVEFNFSNTSRNATHIRWNFGSEYSSTEQNPTIVLYASDFESDIPLRDKFPVTLTVFNGTDSSKITKYVYLAYCI
jgi:hypothetical protein